MKKLIGRKKFNLAVFISGNGSNLNNLIKYSLKKNSKFKINLVISNNPKAKGLNFERKFRIKKKIIKFLKNKKFEREIVSTLKKNDIDFICLAGFMKILPKYFIKIYNGKIINIHPSLLPKYKGLNTHKRALENNEKYSGCTVHYVNTKLDSGKIILQKKVKIFKNDTEKKLAKRVLKQEHILFPKALDLALSNL